MRTLMALLMITLGATPAQAVPMCSPSAFVKDYDYPGPRIIPTTNNLILPTGKPIPAEGQKLILKGRVLDSECKPIPEAMVELWQTGPYGRWEVAGGAELATPMPVFAGAGRGYTSMDGQFHFITAFPAPLRYAMPNINIRIKPEHMREYRTALFFAGDERNETDETYKKLAPVTRESVSIQMQEGRDGELIGTITIVLPGKAPYRTY